MLFINNYASDAVDQAGVGNSLPNHSISIELLDDDGEKDVEEPFKDATCDEAGDLISRTWQRDDGGHPEGPSSWRGAGEVLLGGINKTLTIVGNMGILSLTVNIRASKETVGVEIHPNELWVGGSTVPLWAFRLFNLPQDSSIAYVGRDRGDHIDRCLKCAGRITLQLSFIFRIKICHL